MNDFRMVAVLLPIALLYGASALAQQADGDFVPVTDAMLEDPDPANWMMWRRTLDSWGYSPLDQIDRDNVRELRLVWSRPLADGIQEGTPLVYEGVMFFPNPNDITQAMDAATGDLIWEYARNLPPDLGEIFFGADINRNLAIYGSTIIDLSADDFVYALDATSGQLLWESRVQDYRVYPGLHSSGPITAAGKIFAGRNCRPQGGPEACIITAHDAATGEELWRRRTIPRPGEPGD